jgi:protein-S-isoprenylcysteine O-methyltransferase Ste14
MSRTFWWKGARGEAYVVAQIILIAFVFFGPRTGLGGTVGLFPISFFSSIGGGALILGGVLLLIAAIFRLGTNLTAVPYPKEQGTLVETGPYRLVRHPMYCGGIMISLGWALWVHSWLTMAYAILMLVFFDFKSRKEERWLKAKFSGYGVYQKRVRKLIPFIY